MALGSVHEKFTAALDALVEQVKHDRSVLAALVCGSLSHDTVWAKSDIDLVLITTDEKKPERSDVALYADGVNVHTLLFPRAEFRKMVEGSLRGSFIHSFLAKGRLLYSHDATVAALCARLDELGERDAQRLLFGAATAALPALDKARKWFVTRGDLDYTAIWILAGVHALAKVEVIGAGLLADREVLLQALRLNPTFFKTVYTDLLNTKKSRKNVEAALDAADRYIAERADDLFAPLIDHLREAGEARSATEIEHHFERTFGVAGATTACEYLADRGVFGKAGLPVRLTRKSTVQVQELAFFYAGGPPDEF